MRDVVLPLGRCVLIAATALALSNCSTTNFTSRPPERPAPQVVVVGETNGDVVTVQAGDTLYAISRRSGVPVRSLIDANQLTAPYLLQIGQRIVVPRMRTHTVQSGETLIVVARRYGVESTVLAQTNQLKPPYALRSGQVLVLPGSAMPETTAIALRESAPPVVSPPTTVSTPLPAPTPLPPPALPQAPTPVIIESAPPVSVPAPAPAPREAAPSVVVQPPSPAPSSPPREGPASSEPPASPVLSAPPPRSGRSFMWPVRGNVVSGFGPKSGGLQNDGINIAAPRGTAVRAAESGVVVYTGNDLRGFGNLLLLRHADGWMTAYAHLESIGVQRGQTVSRGQVVGRVGQTGAVTSPQLHFEVRRGTRPVDPRGQLGSLVAAAN